MQHLTPPLPPNANNCLNSDIWQEKRSQTEYGCHTPTFTDNLREKVCIFCDQRKPVSLEEQAFSVILENAELTRGVDSALCHLPHRICWLVGRLLNANLLDLAWRFVPIVAEYGENRPSWFDVEHTKITWLSRFRLACEVHQKLKPYLEWFHLSSGVLKMLEYHSSVRRTYQDFWCSMLLAVLHVQTETKDGLFKPLASATFTDGNNVVLVSPELTEHSRLSKFEYMFMTRLQTLSKTFAFPVLFKPREIALSYLESKKISHLLEDLDPEVILCVDLTKRTWSVGDLDELDRVLSPCCNLTDIYLRQETHTTYFGLIEDVAPAVSRLLSHHPKLQKIGLKGFRLAGTLASFPLPPVEDLRLRQCAFTEGDWNFMANRSDLAFKTLFISSYFHDIQFPSLSRFLQNQAPTLESLGLEFPTLTVEEICKLLRIMAKFNKLRVFDLTCMDDMDFASKEKILIDIMSIHSTRKFLIDIPSIADESNRNTEIDRLNEVVRRSCKVNRRPPIMVIVNKH